METRGKLGIAATVCVLAACLAASAPAKVIYVDDDATGANNGTSWANAFTYLQTALTAAGAGDEIRVAQGRYRPDQGLPPRPPRVRGGGGVAVIEMAAVGSPLEGFSLKSGVAILGGFAGLGAIDPNARDTQRHETILSGDLRGNDVDLWGPEAPVYEFYRGDNSLYVVGCPKTDTAAVLDGVTIESAVQSGFFDQGGSPRLTNCVFRKNSGRALLCEGGQPVLTNCVFEGNIASKYDGGAIRATGARLTLTDCRFLGNSSLAEGGALCAARSDLVLTGCTFEMNAATWGGAIHQTAGTLTLADCTFVGNAAQKGGAAAFAVEEASMARCVFQRNWATTWGGAVENGGSPLTLDRCTFTGNASGNGGALYATRLTSPKAAPGPGPALTRCLFTGNYAVNMGGALYSDHVELTIFNCTFAGNRARTAGTLGWPDIRAGDTAYRLNLENCIVWDGQGSIRSVSAPVHGGTSTVKKDDAIVRYSDVQGGWEGEGNIDLDPCFAAFGYWVQTVNPGVSMVPGYSDAIWIDGDYHVKSKDGRWDPLRKDWVLDEVTSPCIDAGDPNSPVADEPEFNGGRINMGAYGGTVEASKSYNPPPPPAQRIRR